MNVSGENMVPRFAGCLGRGGPLALALQGVIGGTTPFYKEKFLRQR
jgi:hypothetical protein